MKLLSLTRLLLPLPLRPLQLRLLPLRLLLSIRALHCNAHGGGGSGHAGSGRSLGRSGGRTESSGISGVSGVRIDAAVHPGLLKHLAGFVDLCL